MAINFITAKLAADKSLVFDCVPSINRGEHKTTVLKISVNPAFSDYSFSLEFLCPKNFKYATTKLPLVSCDGVENQLIYAIDSSILQRRGTVYVQLRADKRENGENLVFKSVKSSDASFEVLPGIDGEGKPYASNDLVSSLLATMSKAKSLCAAAEAKAKEIETNAQNGVYNCEVPFIAVKAVSLQAGSSATVENTGEAQTPTFVFGIPKGDKGDKGDPGEIIELSEINSLFD